MHFLLVSVTKINHYISMSPMYFDELNIMVEKFLTIDLRLTRYLGSKWSDGQKSSFSFDHCADFFLIF